MSSRWMQRALLGAWLSGAAGCDVFDAELEKRIDEANEDPDSGMPDEDAGTDAGPPPLMLSDVCEATRPVVLSDPDNKQVIPTTGLRPNASESGQQCEVSGDVLARADGFFQISAKAGQRWHFHVDAAAGQNLALLALDDGCDVRSCFASADVCGNNESEHFTFVPDSSGTYVILVEGIDPSLGADLTMLAVSPECGDGKKHHSEVCEDNNVKSGDGCDKFCRVELKAQDSEETEPNDDSYGANVLTPPRFDLPVVVRGKVAGMACQPDYYLLHVDTAQTLTAAVLKAAGGACTTAPPMKLQVLEAEDQLRQGSEVETASKADGTCPSLTAVLAPGDYFIRLQHTKKADQFDYRLTLTFTP